MNLEEIREKVAAYCAGRIEIVACILFGSRVTGTEKVGSDLDAAFLFAPAVPRKEYLELTLAFASELGRLTGLEVHPVVLNGAGEGLREQVLQKGMPAYVGDEADFYRFVSASISLVSDFAVYRDRMMEAYIDRFREEKRG